MDSQLTIIFFGGFFVCMFAVVSCNVFYRDLARNPKRQHQGFGISEAGNGTIGSQCNHTSECSGLLKCSNNSNTCFCPRRYVQTISGDCVVPNRIKVNRTRSGLGGRYNGFTSCVPYEQIDIPGLSISTVPYTANLAQACTAFVIESRTIPIDVEAYHDDSAVLGVDAVSGVVYMNVGFYPCGPSASDPEAGAAEPIVQTYVAQCIDSRGIVSNPVKFDVIFPSCDVEEPVCP